MLSTMKVLYSGTLYMSAGGPAMSGYGMLYGLNQIGVQAEILMYEEKEGVLYGSDVPYHLIQSQPWENKFFYSPAYRKKIRSLGDYDLYHAQGVWTYPTYALIDEARHRGKSYLITPRGMLYPQDIAKHSTLFKRLSLRWRLLDDLNHAACVHATCEQEKNYLRDLGVTSPIAIIPNPIEIKEIQFHKQDKIRRIGYLGRLSPRKRVERLIRGFAALGKEAENAELLIIGGGDGNYEEQLQKECVQLGLNNVRFTGFLTGIEKQQAIASCSVIANPSDFENFGCIITEALEQEIPCIATTGSPWQELITHKCGWWVKPEQEAITDALRQALRISEEELAYMGKQGRQIVEQRYGIQAIAKQMQQLYEWALEGKNPPLFVYTK